MRHYQMARNHGWGGRIVGRPCLYCSRPAVAKEMCMRHYQMARNHGDPLYADKRKKGGMPPGHQLRRGYIAISDGGVLTFPPPATDPRIKKSDRSHRSGMAAQSKRSGGKRRREWEHRRIAKAKKGEIVHHINMVPTDNAPSNLHVFKNAAAHARAHRSLERAAAQFLRVGFLEFDKPSGLYQFSSRAKTLLGLP